MSAVKKVYLHHGDLLEIMLVNELYTRDAAGFRDQLYQHSELIRVHGPGEIAFANPMTRQVSWDGKTNAVSPPPTDAEVMAHPKVKALVEAAEEQLDYLEMCGEDDDLVRNLRAAIAELTGGKDK